MTSMTTLLSETLEDRLIRHEGMIIRRPYLDTTGHWTIGVGHELTSTQALMYRDGVTVQWAIDTLHDDIEGHRTALFAVLPWIQQCSQRRQDVFVELAFNLGVNGLLGFHRALTAAQDGQWQKCSTDLLLSEWATQVKGRALELSQLIRQG